MPLILNLLMFGLGMLTMLTFIFRRRDGAFKINTLNPDKDVYSLKLDTPLNRLRDKQILVIVVEVDTEE